MSTKAIAIAASVVIGAIALVVGVMAVGAVPLGADRPHITDTAFARRTAAADKLQGRIDALAKDVPPALPVVPERITASAAAAEVGAGSGGSFSQQAVPQGATPSTQAVPVPQAQGRTADDEGDYGYEDEDDDRGGEHDDEGGEHEDD